MCADDSVKSEVFGTAVCFMCIKINGVGGGGPPSIHLSQSKWQVQALVHE